MKHFFRFKDEHGFTLAELLGVTIILVTTAAVISMLFYSVLRSAGKAKIVGDLTQNGNYSLSVMTSLIRNSKNLQSVGGISCLSTTIPATPILGPSVQLLGFDNAITNLTCTGNTIASQSGAMSISLIDTNQVEVVPGTCQFSCLQEDTYALPKVTIQFTLRNSVVSTFVENRFQSQFRTTVQLRNKN